MMSWKRYLEVIQSILHDISVGDFIIYNLFSNMLHWKRFHVEEREHVFILCIIVYIICRIFRRAL